MKKAVFPDSSLFLRFSPLDEIDLPQLFDCAEVEVLLALVVTEELLQHQRDHPAPELRQRAKESLRRVGKWLRGLEPIGPAVTASFLDRRPDSETMERNHLNWQHKGDVLLGMLLEYRQARADEGVILLTGDSELATRARSVGVEAAVPSSEYRLAEADMRPPDEKQRLRQELTGFRYRTPALSLSFAGGKDEVVVTIAPQLASLTATMRAKLVAVVDSMGREAAQHHSEDVVEAAFDDLETLAGLVAQASPTGDLSFLGWMAEEEAERYQREVEAYPEKFERYLGRCLEMINEHRRTIGLELEMENTGGALAEDVLLLLTLPEQLEWHWRQSDTDMPAPPAPPTHPRPAGQVLERGFHIGEVSSVSSHLLNRDHISDGGPVGPFPVILKAGRQLQWELGTCHQHKSRLLEPLYARFGRAEDPSNFAIGWEIQEKNSPAPVRGRLLVRVATMIPASEGEN